MKTTTEQLNSLHMLSVACLAPFVSFARCRGINHSTGAASYTLRLVVARQQPVNIKNGSWHGFTQPSPSSFRTTFTGSPFSWLGCPEYLSASRRPSSRGHGSRAHPHLTSSTLAHQCLVPAHTGHFLLQSSPRQLKGTPLPRGMPHPMLPPPQLLRAPRDSAMAMMNKTLTMTKLITALSTKDVGGKGEVEYGRATMYSVEIPALLRRTNSPMVWALGPNLP